MTTAQTTSDTFLGRSVEEALSLGTAYVAELGGTVLGWRRAGYTSNHLQVIVSIEWEI